jgi:asparagine synthase (glutamine-hydrolysing)
MEAVEALVDGERPFGRQIWGLLNIELWHRTFIDGDRPDTLRPSRGDAGAA